MVPRVLAALLLALSSCAAARDARPAYDMVIRGGTIYDGGGGEPYVGDVAIKGDRIAAVSPRLAGGAGPRSTPGASPSLRASSTC